MDGLGDFDVVDTGSRVCLLDRCKSSSPGLFQSQVVQEPVRRISFGEAGDHTLPVVEKRLAGKAKEAFHGTRHAGRSD